MLRKKLFVFVGMAAMLLAGNCYGQELLKNNNWEEMQGNTPANWRFYTYRKKSTIKQRKQCQK